jgi:hypothetical protein
MIAALVVRMPGCRERARLEVESLLEDILR